MNTENQSNLENLSSQTSAGVPKKQNHILKIGLIVILLLTIGAGGGLVAGKYLYFSQPTPSPILSASSSPISDPKAGWKTYTSANALYSFKYPEEQPFVSVPQASGCPNCIEELVFTQKYDPKSADGNTIIILALREDRIKTLNDYVDILVKGDSSRVDLKRTNIGGLSAVSYKLSGGIPPLPIVEYAVVNNGYYYIIRLNDSIETNKNREKNIELFDKILSTFKFLNSTDAIDMSAWKAYKIVHDSQFGFSDYEIRLPDSWKQQEHSSNFQNSETFTTTRSTTQPAGGDFTPGTGWLTITISDTPISQGEKITINGVEFTKSSGYGGVAGSVYNINLLTSYKGKTYQINLSTQDEGLKGQLIKEFDQAVTTFKFIN